MSRGDLSQTPSAIPFAEYGCAVDVDRPPSDVAVFEYCAAHAGAHAFDDQVAFELGDGTDDDDDCPAERAAGIEILAEADVLDVEAFQA